MEYYLSRSDVSYIIYDNAVPVLAIYVAEYMITRSMTIFKLITIFCSDNYFHQTELIDIFKEVVDNHSDFMITYHTHFDINRHYVYLEREGDVAVILLRDTPIEWSVALVIPETNPEDDIF